ncbi:transposase [Thermobifida halotolerans]|uniref:Transposase n=1 Tax=Thermobifida halotolerans TaxID=483545 RepID=A0AA97LXE3_9ACTN|nr:transposase [Thermobifida halotolerans]
MRQRRHPSDLTDARWALTGLLPPAPNTGGRPGKHPRHDIVDAVLSVVRTGCAWRRSPFGFPPWQTVCRYFTRWEKDGVTEPILAVLCRPARAARGRADEPTASVIDSQSAKGAATGPRGRDAGRWAAEHREPSEEPRVRCGPPRSATARRRVPELWRHGRRRGGAVASTVAPEKSHSQYSDRPEQAADGIDIPSVPPLGESAIRPRAPRRSGVRHVSQ